MFCLFYGKRAAMPEVDKELRPTVFFTRVLWAADNPKRLAELKREYKEALKPAA